MALKKISSIKPVQIKVIVAIFVVVLVALKNTLPISAAPNYSYFFLPNSNYVQSDPLAVLRIGLGPTEPVHPTRVDWLDSQGNEISACSLGNCGPLYDQSVADNGTLIWREFYFYISGQQRASGTYSAVAYDHQTLPGGGFQNVEMFRVNFTVGSSGPAPTPPPGPIANLDTSFGTEGIVTTNFSGLSDAGNAVVIQGDGKIIVVGGSYDSSTDLSAFALARYNSDGSMDAGFGNGGKVNTLFNNAHWDDQAYAIALQSDHKIVVAGISGGMLALARYNSNGSLDTGFGTAGLATNDLGAESRGVVIQSDGMIVVAGTKNGNQFIVARYTSGGSLDPGFGIAGNMLFDFGGVYVGANAIALQNDGKIVVVGYTTKSNPEKSYFAMARLNSNGSLDTGFGVGGKVTTSLFQNGYGNAVAIQTDGKIVVGGSNAVYSMGTLELVRYQSDGSLDTSFGVNGLEMTTFNGKKGFGKSLVLLNDDRIVLAGTSEGATANPDVALAVFTNNGSLDNLSSLSNGTVSISSGEGRAAAVQDNGEIVVAGSSGGDYLLMRFGLRSITHIYLPAIIH